MPGGAIPRKHQYVLRRLGMRRPGGVSCQMHGEYRAFGYGGTDLVQILFFERSNSILFYELF